MVDVGVDEVFVVVDEEEVEGRMVSASSVEMVRSSGSGIPPFLNVWSCCSRSRFLDACAVTSCWRYLIKITVPLINQFPEN